MENLHWVGTIFKPINNYPRFKIIMELCQKRLGPCLAYMAPASATPERQSPTRAPPASATASATPWRNPPINMGERTAVQVHQVHRYSTVPRNS